MIRSPPSTWATGKRKPRASGDDPVAVHYNRIVYVVNPARAGMIPCVYGTPSASPSKPRASGDDPGRVADWFRGQA